MSSLFVLSNSITLRKGYLYLDIIHNVTACILSTVGHVHSSEWHTTQIDLLLRKHKHKQPVITPCIHRMSVSWHNAPKLNCSHYNQQSC